MKKIKAATIALEIYKFRKAYHESKIAKHRYKISLARNKYLEVLNSLEEEK